MTQTASHRTRCFSCKALVPAIEGPTHEYILSAPGCWQLYGEILAKEYMPGNYDPDIHRITVDTYAVQHPGIPNRRAIQSVIVHLISLYAIFELGARGRDASALMNAAINDEAFTRRLQWLEPPTFDGTLTVSNVVGAADKKSHSMLVRNWGQSVWDAWRTKYNDIIARKIQDLNITPNKAVHQSGRMSRF